MVHKAARKNLIAYGVAIVATGVSLLIRLSLMSWVGFHAELMTFFPAIILAAYLGGLGPGLLATVLGALVGEYFFSQHRAWQPGDPGSIYGLVLFLLAGTVISVLMESMHRSRRRIAASQRRYAVTLSSIGDAIIATDSKSRITFMNPVAESLTGWLSSEALCRPLLEVFRVVNEQTRLPVEDLAAKVMQLRTVTGLADKSVLLARGGREIPIDDSAAPILDDDGAFAGIVLVFRDVTLRRREEDVEAFRRANERMELAVRGSNIGVWDIDMPNGDYQHGRRYYMNIWEQFGYSRPPEELLALTPGIASGPPWEKGVVEINPDDRPRFEESIRRHLAGEMAEYETEVRIRKPDGPYRTMLARGVAMRDAAGVPTRFIGTLLDITNLKVTESALRESEQRWRSLTEALPQLVWSAAPDGACDYFSAQWTEHTGVPESELLGWRWLETLHPEDREPTRQFWLDSVAERHPYDIEYRVRRRDGEYRWFKTRGVPIRDNDGNIVKWFGSCTDITGLRDAEKALRESEQRWRSLTEALPQLVWSAAPDGACDYFSAQWTQHTGVPEPELLGWRWLKTLHPDDREPTRQFWLDSVAERHPYDIEYRVRRRDGEYRWFKTRGVPIRGSDGNIVKWFGSCTDITGLRDAEKALRESEARFRGTFENAAVGISHAHPSGRLLRVNEKFCEILGYSREELLQKTFQEITHPDDLAESVTSLMELVEGKITAFATEKRYIRKGGSIVWVELSVSLQRNQRGQPDYAIGVIKDISDRRRLDTELRHAKEVAEGANRAKDEFLANVSHEIRTPMNAILGMSELMLETPLREEHRNQVSIIKASAEALLNLINDLLDFSKMEAGHLELDEADFSLRVVLNETLRALALRAHKKGLELACQVDPNVPDGLSGDANRLRQILLNLIGNAIKFTEAGEVIVRVHARTEASGSTVVLEFDITDTGIGIPREMQQKIFNAFEQADTSTTRRYGGTGLGLTISLRLVEKMGGRITVESEVGRGSTFRFALPFGRSAQTPSSSTVPSVVNLQGLRVLVVDDNATNRMILDEWLRAWGTVPTSVPDGPAAMNEIWRGLALNEPFSLLLLDARMPGTDGYELARAISQAPQPGSCRMVLVTSEDRPDDRTRYRALGISEVLMKPIQREELLECISRVLTQASQCVPGPSPLPQDSAPTFKVPRKPLRQLKVLIAEDNEFNQQVLREMLQRRGHAVRSARNGQQALAALDRERFDLLLLDIHMPEMDGFQVIRTIRGREQEWDSSEHLPVIALTALSRMGDRDRCLQAGMDDYISKPVRPVELDAAIDRVTGGQPMATPAATAEAAHDENSLIDKSTLLQACSGDEVLLKKMVELFQEEAPAQLSAVEDAVRRKDWKDLCETAHKLKSLVAVFSASIAPALGELEDIGANGGGSDPGRPLLIAAQGVRDLISALPALTVQHLCT